MTGAAALQREILKFGGIDYVDLWTIHRLARGVVPTANDSDLQDVILDAIKNLMLSGKLEAGELYPPGEFEAWPMGTTEALRRVREGWTRLDKPLNVGDVAWFHVLVTPSSG